jgi:hypothetical protein
MTPVLCKELAYVYFTLEKERAGNERLASLNQSLANDLLTLYFDIDEMDRHHDQKENELHQMRKALSASSKECRKLKNMLERTTSFVNCKNAEHAARTSDLRQRIKKRKDSSTGSIVEAQEKAEEEEPYLANKKNVTNAVIKISKHMDVASGMVDNGTYWSETLEQDHSFASSSSPCCAEGIDVFIKEDDNSEFHVSGNGVVSKTLWDSEEYPRAFSLSASVLSGDRIQHVPRPCNTVKRATKKTNKNKARLQLSRYATY